MANVYINVEYEDENTGRSLILKETVHSMDQAITAVADFKKKIEA